MNTRPIAAGSGPARGTPVPGFEFPANAYYGAQVSDFLKAHPDAVVGALTTRGALGFRGNEPEQARAWQAQVRLLQKALSEVPNSGDWGILLEYSIHRLRKRPDVILLAPGAVLVVEFKMGAPAHSSSYCEQAEDYALCIRDFHSAVRGTPIVPLVCAEQAPSEKMSQPSLTDGVAAVVRTNAVDLKQAISLAAVVGNRSRPPDTWRMFDQGGYNPTPNIVEAARAVYAGHLVAEIGRTDADGAALLYSAERIRHWVLEARERKEHIVCLLTGTPGAGKTLIGLNLILSDGAGRVAGEPGVMLTGNRPLAHVLKTALVTDASERGEGKNAERALDGALQTLLGYLKTHAAPDAPSPPEHVVVYDEAQRAWDQETGEKLLKRRRSEPELFLEILSRLPWSCLVCLVGPGQEINRGEGGMPLWGEALDREASEGRPWRIVAASISAVASSQRIDVDPALHLSAGLRAYRNERHGDWVNHLLKNEMEHAREIAGTMSNPPAWITRDPTVLKTWLRERRRGGRRTGLLVSSGAVRCVADGIPPPPMSKDLDKIANWFLKKPPDFRGSDSLELPLSEFGCQGLELDYVGLCWGGDLIWCVRQGQWVPRRIFGSAWRETQTPDRKQFQLNAYRVLLTRAREGVCIFVPQGDRGDGTRSASALDATAQMLVLAGCQLVTHG